MEIKKYIIPSDIASKKFVVHRLQMILILGLIGSLVGFLGKHFWLFDLASHFRVQMTLFFIFAVMVSAFIRNTSLILLSILCLILNAVPVLMLILPPFSVPSSSGQHLRVLSCNVNSSLGNPQKVLKLIAQENPDIILLMEINQSWVLALDKLKSDYSHFKTKAREDNFGIALFTRTEGSAFEVIDHGSADLPSIKAVIPSKNGLLTIIGTHPPPPVSSKYSVWRNEQLQELAKTASEAEGPFILLGDFNITPWSPHFTDLLSESRLQNSSQGRGIFATWPVWIPFLWIPIDHFLHSDEVVVVDKRVGSAVDSDHFPVIVDITLLPTT